MFGLKDGYELEVMLLTISAVSLLLLVGFGLTGI
jgi:hypothetical protein